MYRHILVPIADSAASRAATEHAAELASRLDAELLVLHVLEPLPSHGYFALDALAYGDDLREDLRAAAKEMLENAAKPLRERGVPVRTRLIEGADPAGVIARTVDEQEIDLVVMGTHGRRGLGRAVLGSVAEEAVRRSSVPHLLIREPDD